MQKVKKQLLAFVLALAMAASLVGGTGLTAFAAGSDTGAAASDEETATGALDEETAAASDEGTVTAASGEETALSTMAASTDWYGDGTATSYTIGSADELIGLAEIVSAGTDDFSGKTITLTADIDLSGDDYSDFVGIGTSDYAFAGTFDGGGHTVTLAIDCTTAAGLFAYVTGATIRNVTTAGSVTSNVDGNSATAAGGTAGLVGYVNRSTVVIKNCANQADITGMGSVGGMVGHTASSSTMIISGCSNTGAITSVYNGTTVSYRSYAGGIAGVLYGTAKVTYCINSGTITGAGYIGGMIGDVIASNGMDGVTVTDCENTGTVTSSGTYAGGLLGYATLNANPIVLQRCGNSGSVTGTYQVGGIMTYLKSTSSLCVIDNLYNAGTITGTYNKSAGGIGGIAGYYYTGVDVTNVYNVGSVINTTTGSTVVAGIFGYSYATYTLENAYSAGAVTYSAGSGAVFVGRRSGGTLTFSNLYYLESLSGSLIGYGAGTQTATSVSSTEMKALASSLGDAFTENTLGDDYHGGYPVLTWELVDTTYQVNEALTNLTSDGSAKIREGYDYEATLTADDGYIVPETITVTVDGNELASDAYTYTVADGSATATLTIPASSITGTITITASAIRSYTVTSVLKNVTSDGAASVADGDNYTATLTPAETYDLPETITVEVTVEEETTELVAGTDYSYDATTGALTIYAAGITGDLTITAKVLKTYTVTKVPANLTITGDDTATEDTDYEATLAANDGYALPDSITVTVGDGEDAAELVAGTGYTYDVSAGTLTVYGASVTGNLTITAGAKWLYGVTLSLTNLESSNTALTAREGDDYETTLTAADGCIVPDAITVTVTAGEEMTELTAGTDYTYTAADGSATASLVIAAASITGDLTITAEAVPVYAVKLDLLNISSSNTDTFVRVGENYAATFVADDGYILPDDITVTVTVGEETTELTAGTDYIYTVEDGSARATLEIYAASITGALTITASAAEKYDVTMTLENLDYEGDSYATEGKVYQATLTAQDGYALPESITVAVGGVTLDEDDYSYDSTRGIITVPASAVTGVIEITALAVRLYTVTLNLTNLSGDESTAASVRDGKDYEMTLTADTGYIVPDSIAVTVGDTALDLAEGEYTYTVSEDKFSAELVIPSTSIDGAITVAAEAVKIYTVASTLENLTGSNDAAYVIAGSSYETTLRAADGYILPESITVEMTVGEETAELTAGTDYTYTRSEDQHTATFLIAAEKLTGDIEITARAVRIYNISVNLTSLSSSNSATTILEKTDYTATLTPDEGYNYAAAVTVTVGGTTLTSGTDYTYDATTGLLTIPADSITGDIVITATAACGENHYWGTGVVTEPTCITGGYTTFTCSECGATCTDSETAALGHNHEESAHEDATCTVDGYTTYICSRCGDTYTDVIAATGHSYEETVVEPTCTTRGYTVHECSNCGNIYYTDLKSPTGHTWGLTQVLAAATCTEDGSGTYTCSVCGETKTDVIAATGHSYAETARTAATCTEDGSITYTCSVCGDTYTDAIAATGHSYEETVVEPTCTTRGYTVHTCSACGDVYYTDLTAAPGHDYEMTAQQEATCTEDGYEVWTCTVCGNSYTVDGEPATGHDYVEDTEQRVEPTCTKEGSVTYVCDNCGDSYTEVIAATGHDYVETVIAPTCTEGGKTEHKCSVCGNIYYTALISATGHTYAEDTEQRVEPTCTEDGSVTYVCSVCGDSFTDTLAATGHSWDAGVVTKAATATEEGEITCTCSRCGETYTEVIEAIATVGDTVVLRSGKTFSFWYTLESDGPDLVLDYGREGDEVLIGDWDGDGIDTVCVRRGNTFYFKNDFSSGDADYVITYGREGDEVLVGDWNCDGKDTLAVRRNGNEYHFKYTIDSGDADEVITYGRAADEVLVGDWDGDGFDTLAVRRNGNIYYFKNTIESGASDDRISYGRDTDEILVGDWDGDEKDTLCARRKNKYYFKNTIDSGDADLVYTYGDSTDESYAGRWR